MIIIIFVEDRSHNGMTSVCHTSHAFCGMSCFSINAGVRCGLCNVVESNDALSHCYLGNALALV